MGWFLGIVGGVWSGWGEVGCLVEVYCSCLCFCFVCFLLFNCFVFFVFFALLYWFDLPLPLFPQTWWSKRSSQQQFLLHGCVNEHFILILAWTCPFYSTTHFISFQESFLKSQRSPFKQGLRVASEVLLEMLMLGKPVIATAYGGNMEFMSMLPDNFRFLQIPYKYSWVNQCKIFWITSQCGRTLGWYLLHYRIWRKSYFHRLYFEQLDCSCWLLALGLSWTILHVDFKDHCADHRRNMTQQHGKCANKNHWENQQIFCPPQKV